MNLEISDSIQEQLQKNFEYWLADGNEDEYRQFLWDTIYLAATLFEGEIKEFAEIFHNSAAASAFEPLDTALRRISGQEVLIAHEISEVANDVVKEIERTRKTTEIICIRIKKWNKMKGEK